MARHEKELDITRNIRMINWLKSELLTDIAALFKELVNGVRDDATEMLAETISNLIIVCYLLSRRLGINYQTIDFKIESKLKLGIIEGHDLEKWYGDLSELSKHMDLSREKGKRI